jgi:hypothetical protein
MDRENEDTGSRQFKTQVPWVSRSRTAEFSDSLCDRKMKLILQTLSWITFPKSKRTLLILNVPVPLKNIATAESDFPTL